MRRLLLGLAAAVLLAAAVAWSGTKSARPALDFRLEAQNPVTHLRLNNSPDDFQFAIVSDRTGGHRPKVFSRAIDQLNLLQPEFVLSVGDLIEGYTKDKKAIARQWNEFQSYTSRLDMPFFYVVGNHDLTNPTMGDAWKEKFGRTYFEFIYREVLFLALDTEDPPGKDDGRMSAAQLAWLDKVLAANKGVRWTLVFLHKPLWVMRDADKSGWPEAEKLLAGRNYTVFAGHVHRYQKFTRQGMSYYMLGTTGGDSRLRGVEYGEVDHLVWVTMKKGGPVVANLLLDAIVREDLSTIPSEEEGDAVYNRRQTYPVALKVLYQGKPAVGAMVSLKGKGTGSQPYADGMVEADGSVRLSTHTAFDGAPAATYSVMVELRKPQFTVDGKQGPNQLPEKYATTKTTPLTLVVKSNAVNEAVLNLD